ncbi:uncharacterized protein A1O5_12490 [Cladophialophora psammophila CBS 110553]|uniref:Uncharacterized protein n=1 Tax=Cladophialophora psammophila CBS 110553 TaxID=1182543 RepID=W9VYA2_9EURO|nr:uncharacterized protein A1O5_12490 [Cladophialophora psammophila CBS 110553]EXJ57700.1 hypothetical protein A1O5_12490 [Cladophialophora psammophila CBS 110553]
MADRGQGSKPAYAVETRGPLLNTGSDSDSAPPRYSKSARRLLSVSVISEGFWIYSSHSAAPTSSYSLLWSIPGAIRLSTDQAIRTCLKPPNMIHDDSNEVQSPTIFPILFSAVAAKFLRAVAALQLEQGTSILALEYLLQCRTVFSTFIAPVTLKTINVLTPLLFLLWALSPLGGQAGLRVISTQESFLNATQNFTYLAFVSEFTNEGINSASAEPLVPINAIFTSAIIGSSKSKISAQDQFGNVKIPIYESLPLSSPEDDSDWRFVPDSGDVQWGSLTGLPLHNLPSTGVSRFTMNTGYMVTSCNVSGHDWTQAYRQSLEQYVGWSGANYALSPNGYGQFAVTNFTFRSLDI